MDVDDSYQDEYFDEEFELNEDNESNWSDDIHLGSAGDNNIHLDSDNFMKSCVSNNELILTSKPTTKSVTRTPSVQYWSCIQCNQLNNLKDTFSKYNMKCLRCDGLYDIKSKVIELMPESMGQTVWKCVLCTFCNPFDTLQCEMCQSDKPDEPAIVDHDMQSEDNQPICAFNKKYCDQYSTTLVSGYLRAICNYYLDFNKTSNLCPLNSTIPDVLSIVVLQFYQFCNFWNMEYVLKDWLFDQQLNEQGCCVDKSTLILKSNHDAWTNAFSSQKVEFKGDYSWTLQIQNIECQTNNTNASCWIGVIESKHDLALGLRSRNNDLFCCTSFGFGVYGYNGNKMTNDISKPFGYPFQVNDIITIKLQCTRSYYELLYFVNGENIAMCKNERQNVNNVVYRLPNDKVYEMVIALKSSNYKIKCIAFDTKPFMLL